MEETLHGGGEVVVLASGAGLGSELLMLVAATSADKATAEAAMTNALWRISHGRRDRASAE